MNSHKVYEQLLRNNPVTQRHQYHHASILFVVLVTCLIVQAILFLSPIAKAQSCGTVVRGSYTPAPVKKSSVIRRSRVVYDDHDVYDDIVFTRFVAVIPLADFPTYSAVYSPVPAYAPVTPVVPTTPATAPVVAAPGMPAAPLGAPGYSGTPSVATPAVVAATPAPAPGMSEIMAELKKLGSRMDVMERRAGIAPPPLAPTPPSAAPPPPGGPPGSPSPAIPPPPQSGGTGGLTLAGILSAKCAVCHSATNSVEKGSGFTLLNGSALVALEPRQINKVIRAGYGKTMPKPESGIAPLTDEEMAILVRDLK